MIWRAPLVLCALVMLAPLHARAGEDYREVPAPTPEEVISVARSDASFPESLRQRNAGKRLEGKYIVYCVRDGSVVRVEPEQSIAGADGAVVAHLKTKHFPFTRMVKFELWVSLEVEAEPVAAPPPAPVAAPAPAPPPPPPPPPSKPSPANKKYRAVALPALDDGAIDVALPQLKTTDGKGAVGAYMLFVEADGTVSHVDVVQSVGALDGPITSKLRTWKFKRQRERLRTVVRLTVGPTGVERF
jgi:hypothetical protein